MDATVLLAFIVVVIVAFVLIKVVTNHGSGKAEFSVGSLLTAKVEFDAATRERAKESIRKAAEQRGETDISKTERKIDNTTSVQLARLLWVDDNPDNNLYETVALEQLGLLITKATSTDAGLFYLSQLQYALAITDLGRNEGPEAGLDFTRRVKITYPDLPVIVYTINAVAVRAKLIGAGATAVVDQPGDLANAVLATRNA
ncbi:MAG: response regulator [Egibacteraceae bacterium]